MSIWISEPRGISLDPERHKTNYMALATPKKEKWKTKKKLKLQRLREKQKRKLANKRDPRRLTVRGKKKKQRFATADERLQYKIEKARFKEAMLIERLKRYEVPKLQGPIVKPHELTGEERFYMKKMAQKGSNYVPVGRRGVFGGVILNMHMHWKKHETVKVICKPCKPGQVQEYAEEIARLSGGVPIHIIGDDTIVFYRGKDYVMPRVMSPIDTLSKKRALEKSKYEQSLATVRHFIAVSEKELELYYRHIALYGDPNDRNPMSTFEKQEKCTKELPSLGMQAESYIGHQQLSETDDDPDNDDLSISELESEMLGSLLPPTVSIFLRSGIHLKGKHGSCPHQNSQEVFKTSD
uniref:CRM domain-containing protein n=1 Tax=Kalanchoe fedtschenkoi TaxID=63787 RepID=A0A7N0RDQ4_KALFE